jgi:hypothetical protein
VKLELAIATARGIQRELDNGKLTVPYPPHVAHSLLECSAAFNAYATDSEKAKALVTLLEAPEPVEAELPW